MNSEITKRARKRLDERLNAFKPLEKFKSPPRGWIRAIRQALGMTGVQLARRLGISAPTVIRFENAEVSGAIHLRTLRRVAEALDCKLVYALVPHETLSKTVDRRARKIALRELEHVAHTMKLEDQSTDQLDLEEAIQSYIRNNLRDRDLWNAP